MTLINDLKGGFLQPALNRPGWKCLSRYLFYIGLKKKKTKMTIKRKHKIIIFTLIKKTKKTKEKSNHASVALLIVVISGTFFLKAFWGSWQTMTQDWLHNFKIAGKISTKLSHNRPWRCLAPQWDKTAVSINKHARDTLFCSKWIFLTLGKGYDIKR